MEDIHSKPSVIGQVVTKNSITFTLGILLSFKWNEGIFVLIVGTLS